MGLGVPGALVTTGLCKQGVMGSNPFSPTNFQVRIFANAVSDCRVGFLGVYKSVYKF